MKLREKIGLLFLFWGTAALVVTMLDPVKANYNGNFITFLVCTIIGIVLLFLVDIFFMN